MVDREEIFKKLEDAKTLEAKIEHTSQIPKEQEELLKKLEHLQLDRDLLKEVHSQLIKKKEEEDYAQWRNSEQTRKKEPIIEEENVFKSANGSFSDKNDTVPRKNDKEMFRHEEQSGFKRSYSRSEIDHLQQDYYHQSQLKQEDQSGFGRGCSRFGLEESRGPMKTLGKGALDIANGKGFCAIDSSNSIS